MKRLAILGGGASGIMAAIAAGEFSRDVAGDFLKDTGLQITIYEASDRIGRSILATGNGRCNFSNSWVNADHFRNSSFVDSVMLSLECMDAGRWKARGDGAVHEFFRRHGLVWREESEGRLYPSSNKASTVLDVLRAALVDEGVRIAIDHKVERVVVPKGSGQSFHMHFSDGSIEHADAVIMACGGMGSSRIVFDGADGLSCQPFSPVLGPLKTDTSEIRGLNNVRVRAGIWLFGRKGQTSDFELPGTFSASLGEEEKTVRRQARLAWTEEAVADGCRLDGVFQDRSIKAYEIGEVLFRNYGVSGIAIFNLSRFAVKGDRIFLDLLPDCPYCDTEQYLFSRRKRITKAGMKLTAERFFCGLFVPSVSDVILRRAGIAANQVLTSDDVRSLVEPMKRFPLDVEGIGDLRQCQVARGGFSVDSFDDRTLASHVCPRLFASGEALDVDAPCGGYNLHWAWTSGMVAGISAASVLID